MTLILQDPVLFYNNAFNRRKTVKFHRGHAVGIIRNNSMPLENMQLICKRE